MILKVKEVKAHLRIENSEENKYMLRYAADACRGVISIEFSELTEHIKLVYTYSMPAQRSD